MRELEYILLKTVHGRVALKFYEAWYCNNGVEGCHEKDVIQKLCAMYYVMTTTKKLNKDKNLQMSHFSPLSSFTEISLKFLEQIFYQI